MNNLRISQLMSDLVASLRRKCLEASDTVAKRLIYGL